MDDKKKQLLNKLKALAERGVAGEKETAQRKLEELMRKYGVEETQIRIEYEFYKELWKEEVEFLFKVFIQKHNIFDPNGSSKDDTTEHKYSEKELRRMVMMEMLLKDKTMMKMLEVEK